MIGTTVGQFRIEEQLGSGGMGVVYRALDTKLDRQVALKFLPPSLSMDAEAKKRFIQEAKAASGLDHPNICTIFDIGETEDGRLFIAMAYYDGQTLKYRLGEGTLTQEDALSIARQIAQGLEAAHRAGIVHRDVKPANIMVTASGRVKLLDFGVAKLEEGAELTKMGSTVGTAAYMSPEQATGKDVDARSDLWSLGVVLYEMLAGAKPFDAGYDQALLYSILNEAPAPISERVDGLPEDVAALVTSLLAKDRNHRPDSAAEVAQQLGAWAGSGTHTAYTRPSPAAREARSLPFKPLGIGAGILLLVLLGWWLIPGGSSDDTGADINTIAVFPFTVSGDPSLAYLDEGMVSLLGTKLDGTDDLKTVDKTALIGLIESQHEGVVTPDAATRMAAQLNAGSFVLGSVTQLAGQIQLDATLYSPRDTVRVQVTASGESGLPVAMDELAIRLVTNRLKEGDSAQLRSVAAVTTSNFEALKAFLEAEKLFRANERDEAYEAYQRAVAADSTFSLAWYRMAKVVRWGGGDFNTSQQMQERRRALDKALLYQDRMPSQYRTLIDAADAFEKGDVTKAQDLYRRQLERYPTQIETLLELSDLLIAYNPLYGRRADEAGPYLEKVLGIEPQNGEARSMMWNLVSAAHDTVGIRHLLDTNQDEVGPAQRVFARLVLDPDPDYSIIEDSIENIGQRANLIWWLGYSFKDPEAIEEISRPLDSPQTSSHNRDLARINRQFALSARGQVAKSDSIGLEMNEFWAEALIDRVMRSMVPMFNPTREELLTLRDQVLAWDTTTQFVSPASVNEGHYGEIRALLLGSLAARMGDAAELQRHVDYLSAKPDARTPGEPSFVFIKTLRAIDAWFRREDEQVLAELENSQMYTNDVCAMCSRVHAQTINRFMRAEILYSRGQYDDALRWYNSLWDGYMSWGADHLGTTYLRTAAILEERRQTDEAAQYYARFVDLWRDADPRYQEMVEHAREREQQIRTGQFAEGGQLIIPVSPSE